MHLYFLKKIRVVLSLLFLVLIVFLFVDFTQLLSPRRVSFFLAWQFVPSFLEWINLFTWTASGFFFILLLTLLFGRVYCSTVCPLGTVKDIFIRIGSRYKKRKGFQYRKPPKIIPYAILLISFLPLLFHNIFFLNLLDPFGLSGKIFSNIFRPVYYGLNNLANIILNAFDIYWLYPVTVYRLSIPAVIFTALFSIAIVLLSVFKGRWYCNSICPVGVLLGLVSRSSVFKIQIDKTSCTTCGLCIKVCKSECIEFKQQKIDFSRCVACYNCFKSCPENSISYKFQPGAKRKDLFKTGKVLRRKEEVEKDDFLVPLRIHGEKKPYPGKPIDQYESPRRRFLKVILTSATTLAGFSFVKKVLAAEEKGISEYPVLPPGSVSIWNYTSNCTACHLCVSVCPTKVLQPTFTEFGLSGLFLPKMDFHTNFCNFECTLCTEICPTGAIYPVSKEQKSTLQIGVSKFIKNICIPVEKHTTCGACSEHCPTKAVEMVPYLGNLKIPQINEKICIGCGACEYACPTKPDKAIYVESNLYHRKAMKPLRKTDQKMKVSKPEEDFPF